MTSEIYPDGEYDIGDEVYVIADDCYVHITSLSYYEPYTSWDGTPNKERYSYAVRQSNRQKRDKHLVKYAWYDPEEFK